MTSSRRRFPQSLKRLGCSYIDVRVTRNRAQNIGVPNGQIANVKDGVLVEGAGSDSIDQQRDNGQFGCDAFWEIKNGKKTRMASVARIVPVPDSQDHVGAAYAYTPAPRSCRR